MPPKQVVSSDKGLKSNLFSQATIHNGTIYVSGNIGIVPSTMKVVEGSVADRTVRTREEMSGAVGNLPPETSPGKHQSGSRRSRKQLRKDLESMHMLLREAYRRQLTCSDEHLFDGHGRLCFHEWCLCAISPAHHHTTFQTDSKHRPHPDSGPQARTDMCLRQGAAFQD